MATKVKDALFIGDAEASQDPDFIELNKITYIMNCAGRQLPNLWEHHGLRYLTFPWDDTLDCQLFDPRDVVVAQIAGFIDEALSAGDAVLVHSVQGTSRCVAAVVAYLMYKYRWGVDKSLDFITSKRPDAAPNGGFVNQLLLLDRRLCAVWFPTPGSAKEADRIRHDEWAVSKPRRRQRHHIAALNGAAAAAAAAGKGKRRAVTAIAGQRGSSRQLAAAAAAAAAGDDGGASTDEEEMALVHTYLNSQPLVEFIEQPVPLPAGADELPTTIHWLDAPRADALLRERSAAEAPSGGSANGPLGPRRNSNRFEAREAATARGGHKRWPTPERPPNACYSSLVAQKVPSCGSARAAPKGILKRGGGGGGAKARGVQQLQQSSGAVEVRVPPLMANGVAADLAALGRGAANNAPVTSLPVAKAHGGTPRAAGAGGGSSGNDVTVDDVSLRSGEEQPPPPYVWPRRDGAPSDAANVTSALEAPRSVSGDVLPADPKGPRSLRPAAAGEPAPHHGGQPAAAATDGQNHVQEAEFKEAAGTAKAGSLSPSAAKQLSPSAAKQLSPPRVHGRRRGSDPTSGVVPEAPFVDTPFVNGDHRPQEALRPGAPPRPLVPPALAAAGSSPPRSARQQEGDAGMTHLPYNARRAAEHAAAAAAAASAAAASGGMTTLPQAAIASANEANGAATTASRTSAGQLPGAGPRPSPLLDLAQQPHPQQRRPPSPSQRLPGAAAAAAAAAGASVVAQAAAASVAAAVQAQQAHAEIQALVARGSGNGGISAMGVPNSRRDAEPLSLPPAAPPSVQEQQQPLAAAAAAAAAAVAQSAGPLALEKLTSEPPPRQRTPAAAAAGRLVDAAAGDENGSAAGSGDGDYRDGAPAGPSISASLRARAALKQQQQQQQQQQAASSSSSLFRRPPTPAAGTSLPRELRSGGRGNDGGGSADSAWPMNGFNLPNGSGGGGGGSGGMAAYQNGGPIRARPGMVLDRLPGAVGSSQRGAAPATTSANGLSRPAEAAAAQAEAIQWAHAQQQQQQQQQQLLLLRQRPSSAQSERQDADNYGRDSAMAAAARQANAQPRRSSFDARADHSSDAAAAAAADGWGGGINASGRGGGGGSRNAPSGGNDGGRSRSRIAHSGVPPTYRYGSPAPTRNNRYPAASDANAERRGRQQQPQPRGRAPSPSPSERRGSNSSVDSFDKAFQRAVAAQAATAASYGGGENGAYGSGGGGSSNSNSRRGRSASPAPRPGSAPVGSGPRRQRAPSPARGGPAAAAAAAAAAAVAAGGGYGGSAVPRGLGLDVGLGPGFAAMAGMDLEGLRRVGTPVSGDRPRWR